MTDEHDEHDDEQVQVRRLLRAAAAPAAPAEAEEVPDEVAARLDDALAALVAERSGSDDSADDSADVPHPGTVTDLAKRRRRRWPQLLVAAAAVSVVGLGVGNLVQSNGGDAASSTDQAAAGMAEEQEAAGAGSAPQAAPESNLRSRQADGDASLFTGDRPRLRTASLALGVQRIEDFGLATPVDEASAEWQEACVRPTTGVGDAWLPVRLDGQPAVLVLRAPTGGRRTGDVFGCGAPVAPVASVTVDAR